jgi:hypothetical protein
MSSAVPPSPLSARETTGALTPRVAAEGQVQDHDKAAGSPARTPAGGKVVRWRVGEAVEVWIGQMLRHRGVVEESAPHLGVVWLREWGTGARILIDLDESGTEVRRPDAPRAPR